MTTEGQVRPTAQLLELLKVFALRWIFDPFRDDVEEVFREYERNSLSVNAKLFLEMTQEVAKINVEDVAVFVHHDVIRIPVTDSQDERGHAITSTRVGERFDGLLVSIPKNSLSPYVLRYNFQHLLGTFVFLFDPLVELSRVDLDSCQLATLALDSVYRFCVPHYFDHPHVLAC